MRISNNKKMVILISIIFLVSFYSSISTILAYGDSFQSAETITSGTHNFTLASDDDQAFYRVFCEAGNYLEIILTVDYPPYDIRMYLYDQDYDYENSGQTGSDGIGDMTEISTHLGPYYIKIIREEPDTGSIPFTLEISGATGTDPTTIIPIIIISVISGVVVTGIVIFILIRRRRK